MLNDKTIILDAIIEQLHSELNTAISSADSARLAATDEQSVAETQYDTLGIEASYLAHGQSERAAALINDINLYKKLKSRCQQPLTEITIGALVEITGEQANQQRHYFIGPSSGGIKVCVDSLTITVISSEAPLAQELLQRQLDDEIVWPPKSNSYWLISQIS
ncbi:hypothetical protein [Thalassotalea maritima]|uniref:hypothetical protein n=1 Tax=Thalassotalea maritima TaxID=3242416 RepID=UPI003528012B